MDTTAEKPCRWSSFLGAAVSVTVALILERFCWGFTVDDAWIVSRVAHNGLMSGTYSFNLGGPVTDGVTPLGFAHLLGVLGSTLGLESALQIWALARWLGVISFVLSLGVAGFLLGREGRWGVFRALTLSFFALTAAAWSGAGLSTPLVGLLVILGAVQTEGKKMRWSGLFLGCAIAWRPELVPFALAWVCCRHLSRSGKFNRELSSTILIILLIGVIPCVVRWFAFGRWVPLAAIAKGAEPRTALFYALVTALWCGLGWLVLLRNDAFRRPGLWGVPWLVHLLAIFFAGGDWMPALRLSAPLIPLLVWTVGRELKPSLRFWLGLVPALGFTVSLGWAQGADWRAVAERRLALVAEGRPFLTGARVVAATDIGWVGLATQAKIVDLGGVTDPKIAPLPGGHTSKAIAPGLFSDRDVDTWVIRALDRSYEPGQPLETIVAAYLVDARLLSRNADVGFVGVATLPLRGTRGQYVVARRSGFAAAPRPLGADSFF